MNQQSDDKSSATYFAELLTGTNVDKASELYKARFCAMLSLVNFRLIHNLLKTKFRDTSHEEEVNTLPKLIVDVWKESEIELLRTEFEEYSKHMDSALGQLFKGLTGSPDDVMKKRIAKIVDVANIITESLTKSSGFTFEKKDESKQ